MSKIYTYCFVALLAIGEAKGQTSTFEMDKFKFNEIGTNSNNSGLLQTIDFQNLGESYLYYQHIGGKFKHPMLAKESSHYGFSSERYQKLKEWKLYGKFDLDLGKETEVPHTAQLNPLRLNPYVIVDSLSGNWNKQTYGIEAKVASPLWEGRYAVGLGLKYKVETGARQRDPRPENTTNRLELKPSFMYKHNERHTFGVGGIYQSFVEDFTITNINNSQVHNLYKLIGLGEYVSSAPILMSSSGPTRRYSGDLFGGSVQYLYTSNNFKILGDAYIHKNTERATDGTVSFQNAGKHSYMQYGLNIEALYRHSSLLHRVDFSWDQKDVDNKEYHQYQNTTTREFVTLFSGVFNTNLITETALHYNIAKYKDRDISWKLGVGASYKGWDNRYSINESQQTVDRLSYIVSFDKYFISSEKAGFQVTLGLEYSDAFKTKFAYEEKEYGTDWAAKEILYPTNDFLKTDFWSSNLDLKYIFKQNANSKTQFFIKMGGFYRKPTQENMYFVKDMSRLSGYVSIGVYSF